MSLLPCRAQVVPGCTDPKASNFDPGATENDGSCTYNPISITAVSTFSLDSQLMETSGLILWDGNLWTHNDNEDLNLYGLDTLNAEMERTFHLEGVENVDWEEISHDEAYIYLGDFGNNTTGNRSDLHILRVAKKSIEAGDIEIDTIWFSYADQLDMSPAEPNLTDFDCEAFVVSDDSIYLFTKQWISNGTTVYRLPKTPGDYQAKNITTFDISGLVTGATWIPLKNLLVLCGYNSLLDPFIYLLYDYQGMDFFTGNKRRAGLSLPFHQVEGIATSNGLKFYLSNEAFTFQSVINSPQQLHIFDLEELLHDYLALSRNPARPVNEHIMVYPNPASDIIQVEINPFKGRSEYKIFDSASRIIMQGVLASGSTIIPINHLSSGTYSILITGQNKGSTYFIKQ